MRQALRSGLFRLLRCRAGASAVEFAVAVPFLVMALAMMVDVGLGVVARMELDRNVRSGVQAAMTLDRDENRIAAIVRMAARDADVAVDVLRICRCGGEEHSCNSYCSPDVPPSYFYSIEATRPHPGIFFNGRPITSATLVQLR